MKFTHCFGKKYINNHNYTYLKTTDLCREIYRHPRDTTSYRDNGEKYTFRKRNTKPWREKLLPMHTPDTQVCKHIS